MVNDRKDKAHRREFRTLSDHQRCVLLGACLTSGEEKKLLRNAGYQLKNFTETGIHRLLVKAGRDDEILARRIDSMFRNRYENRSGVLDGYSEMEIVPMWREYMAEDDCEWLVWALLTDTKFSDDFAAAVLEDFYALQHKISREAGKKAERIEKLSRKAETLEEKLKAARKREREYKRRCRKAEKDACASQKTSERLQSLLDNSSNLREETGDQQKIDQLIIRVHELEIYKKGWKKELEKTTESAAQLSRENYELLEQNRSARKEIQVLLGSLQRKKSDCSVCPNRDLCDRNIFLVGGITKLEAVYRDVIKDAGGDFKYHDGRQNSGEKRLRDGIGWADVVLCPVDVNSHRAALGVKKICKKMQKPFMMLRCSSVSSISRALDRVIEERRK